MRPTIDIVHGPNLHQLGARQPEIYGSESFHSYLEVLRQNFQEFQIIYFQSAIEGELINRLYHASEHAQGIIINAGAYTHTSIALGDALASIHIPKVEVHVSNIVAREAFRHQSFLSPHVNGVIFGFGLLGYTLAMNYFRLQITAKL